MNKSTLLSKTEKALKDRIRGEEVSNYDRAVIKNKCVWFIIVPLAITILTCIGIYYFTAMTESSYINYIIGIVINLIFWLLSSLLVTKPKLFKHNESIKLQIEKIVEERFNRETT